MNTQTAKRLTTRITDHVRDKLQMAADLVGATLNQFVVHEAMEKTQNIIESESTIVLTRRDSLMILDLIANPVPRNAKFLEAQARYLRTKNNTLPSARYSS